VGAEPDSALADWSAAAAPSALFFLWLFFVPVWLAVVEESALESAGADFFWLDFLLVVSVVELSSAASFLDFLDFFFLVVVVSLLWSLELACAFAITGTDTTSNRHRAAIHVVSFMGNLLIGVLVLGAFARPQVVKGRNAWPAD